MKHYAEVPLEEAEEGSRGLRVRWIFGPKTGPKHCYLRIFEMEPGGWSPRHAHPGEHAVFVLQGKGIAVSESGEAILGEGCCLHVPGNERHQIRNPGPGKLVFLCVLSAGG